MDAVIRKGLEMLDSHGALLMVIIAALLILGLASCFLIEKRRFTTREVALMGMLVALNVVMAEVCKIVIIPNVLVLSLGFLPLALSGMLFGIVPTVTVAVIADVIGALIFSSGSFYFGYTF